MRGAAKANTGGLFAFAARSPATGGTPSPAAAAASNPNRLPMARLNKMHVADLIAMQKFAGKRKNRDMIVGIFEGVGVQIRGERGRITAAITDMQENTKPCVVFVTGWERGGAASSGITKLIDLSARGQRGSGRSGIEVLERELGALHEL